MCIRMDKLIKAADRIADALETVASNLHEINGTIGELDKTLHEKECTHECGGGGSGFEGEHLDEIAEALQTMAKLPVGKTAAAKQRQASRKKQRTA